SCSSVFFFFSSRRRHTRFSRDWSSDVCSSDLHQFGDGCLTARGEKRADVEDAEQAAVRFDDIEVERLAGVRVRVAEVLDGLAGQIGRASCRERVEVPGSAGPVTMNTDKHSTSL